jgi:signal transduction histidine kinase/CheY-like chemotaxis protein
VYSSHAVMRRHGHDPEFFCIDVDLTDRKLAEEALKELNSYLEAATARAEELAVKAESSARAKSEFLALMSHELRTPLNGVLGFAELLSGTRLDEEQEEYTRTILDSGNHLLDVVNDILDFSSIEKGCMQIESAPIVIATLVEATCRAIRKAATDKGLEFRCVIAGDIPPEITSDGRRIRQILINLLGNAVKFTQQGSVVLMVSPAFADGGPALDFSVEDSGPGIARETLGQLFKPFTQADSTVSRQFEGTGLGLAISRRLAEAMGGTLDVESTSDVGSKFTFRLPLDQLPQPQPQPGDVAETSPATAAGRLPQAAEAPASPEGSLILVVEDDAANRMLAGKMLEHLLCRVEFAANGQEAVDAFAPGKYSAILMDMQMPVMDGMEATGKIRELESGGRTPIIALTANVMPSDRELCIEGGMDEFLTKPFKLGDLERMLARFLQP